MSGSVTHRFLRVDEAAAVLRCSRSSVYRRIDDGSLPAFRLGRDRGPLRIRENDLAALLRPGKTGGDTVRIGRPPERRRSSGRNLDEARLRAARQNARWVEIEPDLVQRGPLLVSAGSDLVYKPHLGVVWERGSSNVIAGQAPLHWYEPGGGGEPVFVERQPGTWSERYEKQLRRQAS